MMTDMVGIVVVVVVVVTIVVVWLGRVGVRREFTPSLDE
jgi:ABC-type transporter Mla subunit MlaD